MDQLKLPALVTSALVILMMIIGLATPLWVRSSEGVDQTYGIRDIKVGSTTTNFWDSECTGVTKDECSSAQGQLKAGFAFIFMGVLANLAVIACLVAANGYAALPAPAGEKIATTGAAGVAAVLYFMGVVMAVNGYPTYWDKNADKYDIGVGSIFLILALIAAVAVPAMTFMGLEDGGAAETAAPGAAAAEKEPETTTDVEAPAAADAPAAPPASA